MIARLVRLCEDGGGALRRCVAGWVVAGVLQGAGFILLVPVLRALIDDDTDRAWRWGLVMVAVFALYGAVRHVAQIASYTAAVQLSRGLFDRLGDKVAQLPLGWFDQDRVGSIGRITSKGVIDVMGVPAHLFRPFTSAIVTPVTVLAAMAFFDWRLALAAVATVPIAFLVYRWAANLTGGAEHVVHHAAADAGGRLVEFAQSQAVLRSCGRTVHGHQQLDDALFEHRRAGRALMTTSIPGLVAFTAILQVAFTIVLIVGVAIAANGSIDGPELVVLLVLVVRSIEPLVAAAEIGGGLKIATNAIDRAEELLAEPTLPQPLSSGEVADASVQFESVDFGYGETPVVQDITLDVPAGEMLALVGPSGSGKTTLARLIARFWDVDGGAVRIGGVDVRELTTEALMANIAIVFQETYLFAGTVAENLRLARPDATDDDLARVATLARLDEMIERLPDGWDTEVGEGGSRLSGGERQRVSIARALLKDAPIVLLDEATAAIDPQNEVAIQNALDELHGQRTIIVIAHRLATITGADQIAVLDDGAVAELGTHDELISAGGRYEAFWHERNRAGGWRLTGTAT